MTAKKLAMIHGVTKEAGKSKSYPNEIFLRLCLEVFVRYTRQLSSLPPLWDAYQAVQYLNIATGVACSIKEVQY
jgi:hypothetical protein